MISAWCNRNELLSGALILLKTGLLYWSNSNRTHIINEVKGKCVDTQ